jgi:hypothetical protein
LPADEEKMRVKRERADEQSGDKQQTAKFQRVGVQIKPEDLDSGQMDVDIKTEETDLRPEVSVKPEHVAAPVGPETSIKPEADEHASASVPVPADVHEVGSVLPVLWMSFRKSSSANCFQYWLG